MKASLKKFKKVYTGWEIIFNVELTDEEFSKCNMEPVNGVGDYVIELQGKTIIFECIFDKGELNEDETIEERLTLIEKDIKNLAQSCLKS
ncbi:hypothetical protein DSECCO2_311990 [anaerobic digester metagenome]